MKLSDEFVIGLGNRKIVNFRLVPFVSMTTYYASQDTMDRYKCIQLRTMEDTSCFGCKGIYIQGFTVKSQAEASLMSKTKTADFSF